MVSFSPEEGHERSARKPLDDRFDKHFGQVRARFGMRFAEQGLHCCGVRVQDDIGHGEQLCSFQSPLRLTEGT
jgi:hypothetical protein